MHIPDPPYSPHVKFIIINILPPGLISIEELVSDKEEEPMNRQTSQFFCLDLFTLTLSISYP